MEKYWEKNQQNCTVMILIYILKHWKHNRVNKFIIKIYLNILLILKKNISLKFLKFNLINEQNLRRQTTR